MTPILVRVTAATSGALTAHCGVLKSIAPRNWLVETVSGNLTSTTIRLTESGMGVTSLVGSSAAQAGNYTSQGGNSIGATISSNAGQVPGAATYYAVGTSVATPSTVNLSDDGTQVGAASVTAGTVNVVLHQSALAVTVADAKLVGVTCTTAGTYVYYTTPLNTLTNGSSGNFRVSDLAQLGTGNGDSPEGDFGSAPASSL